VKRLDRPSHLKQIQKGLFLRASLDDEQNNSNSNNNNNNTEEDINNVVNNEEEGGGDHLMESSPSSSLSSSPSSSLSSSASSPVGSPNAMSDSVDYTKKKISRPSARVVVSRPQRGAHKESRHEVQSLAYLTTWMKHEQTGVKVTEKNKKKQTTSSPKFTCVS